MESSPAKRLVKYDIDADCVFLEHAEHAESNVTVIAKCLKHAAIEKPRIYMMGE